MGKLLLIREKFESSGEIDILFNSFDLVSYWLEQYFSINELSENHVIYLRIEEILEKYYLVDEVNTEEPAINISKTENIIIWNITSPIYLKRQTVSRSNLYCHWYTRRRH